MLAILGAKEIISTKAGLWIGEMFILELSIDHKAAVEKCPLFHFIQAKSRQHSKTEI